VSERGIEVDKAKIKVIEQLPPIMNVKWIRGFLGRVGFYRCFVKDFSQISRPLTNLLAKDAPFEFTDEFLDALHTLKKPHISAPIIQPPDWSLSFEIPQVQAGEETPIGRAFSKLFLHSISLNL
jgi:hypothetical protein